MSGRSPRRPVPLIGDRTSAADRATSPTAWRMSVNTRDALYEVLGARRDVRRFRPDAIGRDVLDRVLGAAHTAPSVGHSQPWRFVVVDDATTRQRAGLLADTERLAQAELLDPQSARQLLDLQLEGIREAPVGVVVCCDRRAAAGGVLGRATFPDADLWSCACAIENLWLAARVEGLGTGWVTLFRPADLVDLIGLPDGVETLGWLCLGWPDERPLEPGLQRAGWSRRASLDDVVFRNRWPSADKATSRPVSRLRAPMADRIVAARDDADKLLMAPSALGVLDAAVSRAVAAGHRHLEQGTLVLVAGRHLLGHAGASAYDPSVTDEVLTQARRGHSAGAVAARAAGLGIDVVDAGTSTGNLTDGDPLAADVVRALLQRGEVHGARATRQGLIALGEIGIGNTTVAATLAAHLLDLPAEDAVGLGSGADSEMVARKQAVVVRALSRWAAGEHGEDPTVEILSTLGGPEFAYLTGVVLGAAGDDGLIVLDGLATGVAALLAVRQEPAVASRLIAGQRSRERVHGLVLRALGLEPLLDLRMRAGEGVGACLAAQLLLGGLRVRRETATTTQVDLC